ncbi:MAG TPA: papain-like cysteine protease family protein [Candidatus Dormibacteraeota bacterium]|nr:papain-like cysteine protease family protein [Candidatus Dormibacteraeota bacterium]
MILLLAAGLALLPMSSARSAPPGVWLDVPFVHQRKKNACGAASLSMLMRYWEKQQGEPVPAGARQNAIEQALDPHDRGIANTAMAVYLRDSGFRVFAFAGRWDDLRENLSKGRPLIAGLGPPGGKGPLHYVVVAGIDWQRNFVFLNDPAQRKLFRMTRGQFVAEWRATGQWTLLAVPKLPE